MLFAVLSKGFFTSIRIRVMVQISSLVFIDREVVSFFDFAANCKLRYCLIKLINKLTKPGM